MTSTHDAGIKSGMVFGGVLRIYTADKADFVDITFTSAVPLGADATVTFTNKASENNETITLS